MSGLEGVAEAFAKYFENWNIRLTSADVANRRPGLIQDHGWTIRFVLGSDARGEYVECYASHRMTNDRHFRIYDGGEFEGLAAIQDIIFYESEAPATKERARRDYEEHNETVAKDLKALGLYPEGDINAYLRTRRLGRKEIANEIRAISIRPTKHRQTSATGCYSQGARYRRLP